LYRSLIQADAPGQVNIQTPNSLIYGTDVPYADYHEFGTRHIPARPFLRFSVERGLDVKVAREIDMFFQDAFNQGGP